MSILTFVSLAMMGLRGGRMDTGKGGRKAREMLRRETPSGRGGRRRRADRLSRAQRGLRRDGE